MEKKIEEKFKLKCVHKFNPRLLVPQESIRALCFEDKCNNFKKNYMCPPFVWSVSEAGERLKKFTDGYIIQYEIYINPKNNEELAKSKVEFHRIILEIEEFIQKEKKTNKILGFIGGSCQLCFVCKAAQNEPCPYEKEARMSLEAIAVDLISLLEKLGLDYKFHKDKIVWTGAILLNV